jgi:Rieske Fe-S protein
MQRVLAAVLAVLLTGALGVGGALAQMPKSDSAQPKSMEQQKSMEMNADKRLEGTIKSVQGSTVTLDDGTTLSIPSSVKVSRAQLKPGAMIVAEYQERGGQRVATAVQIKG